MILLTKPMLNWKLMSLTGLGNQRGLKLLWWADAAWPVYTFSFLDAFILKERTSYEICFSIQHDDERDNASLVD